ncbi:MAG: DUF1549 domain-containing protein, partial [Planctomycetota bacterium]
MLPRGVRQEIAGDLFRQKLVVSLILAERLQHPAAARAKAVDRLLATDAHAERLTAEWLDVARYSDTYGYQRDDPRFVWPYRDWVLKSFRDN